MKKSASILDYSYPFLDPVVWDHDQKLYSYHKDFILRLLNTMYETYQLKQPETWITDIIIIGSLTTSKWLFTSDVDVHMVVNLPKFIETNMPGADPKVAFDFLDNTRKEFDRAKILAPMTQHPIEFYFEVHEFVKPNTSLVGIYSISQDAWLKAPIIFEADVDFEESKKQVMTEAESIAQALDGSFGKIDRQIDRISELEHVISTWGPDKQQLFYNKIEEKLKTIEAEILKDLELRQALIDARHTAQNPMADIEIKFKWLQRFGFFGILSNLKELMKQTGGQVTLQELPLIKKIVTDSSLKESFLKEALEKQILAVDFDDTIAHENEDKSIGEPEEGVKEALTKLKDGGYEIEIYSHRANDDKGADEIKEWLDSHEIPYDSILNVEKPIATYYIDNRAIKYTNWTDVLKQVGKSDKTASLVISKLSQKYWLDPSGKEFEVGPEGHIGWVVQNILHKQVTNEAIGYDEADDLIRQGWTRVTTESDYDFALEVADLNNLPSYIDNFVAQHYTGGGIEIDDLSGEYQDLADPFPSLRKAIYQARRLRNAASLFSKRDIIAKTKKVKQGDYSCIMAMIPHGIAQEIVEFGVREIPDEDLYTDEDGNLGRELQAHVTILYGLLTDDAKSVRRSFNDSKPFQVKLGKVRHFQPEDRDFDVVTVEVISDDLHAANKMIADNFDAADDLPSTGEYKPHITIAYVKRNAAKKHIGSDEFEGIEVELDTLVFSPRKGNKTYFSIGSNKKHASVENVETPEGNRIPVLVNPSANELLSLANRAQGHALRGLVDPSTGDLYAWEAYKSIHNPMIFALGLDMNYDKYNGIASKHILHFSGDYVTRMLDFQKEVRESLNTVNASIKQADFLPSLTTQAPDNKWQFAEGGDDKEIAVDPDAVSDETTYDAPCTVSKPRSKEVWRQFISMFSNLFSKNDTQKISAYDPELEEANKDALGEDETALEYSKGFYDPKKHDFPHNTTWDSLVQDGEPSKPTSVTYSPQISNEDNLDQNSPGGYPRRFMGKPKGEYFSNEGEVNNTLIQMLRNRANLIDTTTEDITKEAFLEHAYWIDPSGKVFEVRGAEDSDESHSSWIWDNEQMLRKNYGIKDQDIIPDTLVSYGWIRIGDGVSSDSWQVQLQSLSNIPSVVDNVLAQFVPEGAEIEFTDSDNQYITAMYPFKRAQLAVNRALRMQQQPAMAASLKTALVKQYALYVNNIAYPAVRTLTQEEALNFVKQRFPEAYAKGTYQIKEERMKVASLNTEAGSQSASVPDYLIDEWKTEQIHNDTDEEPYVNHDQRDYPYGMHDSPENTHSNIGWPKDQQPSVVHLDTLENPAFRRDPFGIGSYHITYYNSMPMSDGIEKTNPD